jgi:hypothetical protein
MFAMFRVRRRARRDFALAVAFIKIHDYNVFVNKKIKIRPGTAREAAARRCKRA